MPYKLQVQIKKLLADTYTPVCLYLKLRDLYRESILLESTDYHAGDNSFSYICFEPIAKLKIIGKTCMMEYPDGKNLYRNMEHSDSYVKVMQEFLQEFEAETIFEKGLINGIFGYTGFEAIQWMENIKHKVKDIGSDLPFVEYKVFRYIIAFNHFNETMYLLENKIQGQKGDHLDELEQVIRNRNIPKYPFRVIGDEREEINREEFISMCEKAIDHCKRGDVFQLVLSRKFSTPFFGDDFNVYRSLRALNPSPYLFYFDFANYHIFGSSPEAQLRINNGKAYIYPIAGTFKRSGSDLIDAEEAKRLQSDPKENAEHIMLVDLARNDLSRHCDEVKVEVFREVQYFSHVIHLVSKVSGILQENTSPIVVLADTFPAGTLSGAPKIKALELINKYEHSARGFYGGMIGYIGFDGQLNKAILIRSFLSKNNTLHYQAGAGIVAKSNPESELQEINNKLGALRQAIKNAQNI